MDNGRFLICRASAGSGKTYTLVRQYLLLALSANEEQLSSRFGRILAITFTNKAAGEMKERILRELDSLASGQESQMGLDLSRTLGMDMPTLQRQAATVRQGILHNYSDLAVCTIDSFTHRIVRTFAHDLNLPLQFEVEIEQTQLIQNAVDDMMALAGTEGGEELTRILCDFAESRMTEGKSYNVEDSLTTLAEELFKERTPHYLKRLQQVDLTQFRHLRSQMAAVCRDYEHQLCALGAEGVELYRNAGLEEGDFYQSRNGAGAYFRKLAEGSTKSPGRYALEYLEGDRLGSAKCPASTREALAAVKPALADLHRRITQFRAEGDRLYNTLRQLLPNLYPLALIGQLNQLVADYSRDNEIVHISEFNRRIAEVVQNEPAPFLYERLASRYYNYLIDEFQDTSRLQWQNLVPLLENGIASGHTSLVVGDGKQAIYRFRQGDVDQFIRLPRVDNPLHGRLLERPGVSQISQLERNFRSGRVLVEFNNQFFEWVVRNRFADIEELQALYLGDGPNATLSQQPVHEGGYVQLRFLSPDGEIDEMWEALLADLRHQTEELGYRYRDIVVLARKNSTLTELSTYLTEAGIPVISNESFILSQSRVVLLLRCLLQYIADGSDRVAAARVLLLLHELGIVRQNHSARFLADRGSVDLDDILTTEGITLHCNHLRSLDLYDCCEEALRLLRLEGIETAYTATFLGKVSQYLRHHRHDVTEFLEWFDAEADRLATSSSEEQDAVRLMTIHKAKGLEAPIVLYPILEKQERNNSIWVEVSAQTGVDGQSAPLLPAALVTPVKDTPTLFDNDYADELHKSQMDHINLLYVALTRPRQKLLVYCRPPKADDSTCYSALLRDYMLTRTEAQQASENLFCLGEDNSAPNGDPSPLTAHISTLQALTFPAWTHRIAIAQQSAQRFGQLEGEAIRRGNQVHELLATITNLNEAEARLEAYLRHHPDEDPDPLRTMLHDMMQQPEVARFFNPTHTAKSECNLAWHGEVIRPDRIVYTPNCVWVVDFKTGHPKPEHRDQVLHYCDALRAMNHPTVQGYLLYIGQPRCQVIPCQ